MAKPKQTNPARMIDKAEIQDLLAQCHIKQLYLLLERLEQGLIEPQEMRLIWDMVKTHNIGLDSVDELVRDALNQVEEDMESIELDESWSVK